MDDGTPIDFAFLAEQTFGDATLTRDLLALFVEQARRLVPRLADLTFDEQTATAHLLKGSCQGVGARSAAVLLERFDRADLNGRRALLPELAATFNAIEAAAAAHLAGS